LKLELVRGEKHAEALMHIARTCDRRVSETKEQHAAALRVRDAIAAKMEDENTALKADNVALKAKVVDLSASHAIAISKLEAQHKEVITKLEAESAALKAQAATTLTEIHAAVTTGAMEILPVRRDSRQFVEWRIDGIPRPPVVPQFDRTWCAVVCAGGWIAAIDAGAGDERVEVTRSGSGYCTFRSAAPLPRSRSPRLGSGAQPPAYRVIIEAYGAQEECALGFVPSHHIYGGSAIARIPFPELGICNYGGWYIDVAASRTCDVERDTTYSGWTVMTLAESAYATTTEVPPVPAGGAVEFAVDYAAGTCRVAFYTPAAVARGFVDSPQATMELRFVATAASKDRTGLPIPARTVPTAADSGVALYPVVGVYLESGNAWRFAAI
jgi:hypothetical protein